MLNPLTSAIAVEPISDRSDGIGVQCNKRREDGAKGGQARCQISRNANSDPRSGSAAESGLVSAKKRKANAETRRAQRMREDAIATVEIPLGARGKPSHTQRGLGIKGSLDHLEISVPDY